MTAAIVFIHGWGFNGSIWHEISGRLSDLNSSQIELGFIGKPIDGTSKISDDTIIVGHSLGVLWALQHLPRKPLGLISICGFDRFSPPVPRAGLELMKRGLNKNAIAQMTHFWRSCATEQFADATQLNQAALTQGLDGLMNWDARAQLENLPCPLHVMASRDDEIVSKKMSKDIWGDDKIIWSPGGGHALPLTQPKWCADQIRAFVEHHE